MSLLESPSPAGIDRASGRSGHALWAHITPNWFASVMGTGIVANAAASLTIQPVGLRQFATLIWALAGCWLAVVCVAFTLHWVHNRAQALRYADHPVLGHFYGAVPMALLTVGAGTLALGPKVFGAEAALAVDAVLWSLGTALGLGTCLAAPYRMMTRPPDERGRVAVPGWLMPLVPPMVSATTGAMLLPHLPAGQWRVSMLLACYGMFGMSLLVGMITITMVWSRLVHHGLPATPAIPTLWITLGLIGQSVTAANLLGGDAHLALADPFASGLRVFGLLYGAVMGGFGVLMFLLAAATTWYGLRQRLRFSLTWWSFTFPVGRCVTGASAFAVTSGSVLAHWLAPALYLLLLGAWGIVAAHTVRGLRSRALLHP